MKQKAKIFTRDECVRIIQNNGFVFDHSNGGHDIYKRNGVHLSVPAKHVNPMLFRRLMRENNMKEIY